MRRNVVLNPAKSYSLAEFLVTWPLTTLAVLSWPSELAGRPSNLAVKSFSSSMAFTPNLSTEKSEVLQLCSHPVIGWQDAPPGIFGLWFIQVAAI
jgi:hypothetical protein